MTERREDTQETAITPSPYSKGLDFVAARMHVPLVEHPYLFTLAVLIVSLLVFSVALEVLKVFVAL